MSQSLVKEKGELAELKIDFKIYIQTYLEALLLVLDVEENVLYKTEYLYI